MEKKRKEKEWKLEMANQTLMDRFGRMHDYLRLSVTPHCNLRCTYCMPMSGDHPFLDRRWMGIDEIHGIASAFVNLGVHKIRLTGGEPLVRKDIGAILDALLSLPASLSMSTNGIRLDTLFDFISQGHMQSVNISLDTLARSKYLMITKRDEFETVWSHIKELSMMPVRLKLNVVVMKGVNDGEVLDFMEITQALPIEVRFIEYMPFSGNGWDKDRVVPSAEILKKIRGRHDVSKVTDDIHDTGRKYQARGYAGQFAVISTMTQPFCAGCNRMRLTADGKMKNCLFSKTETDLLTAYRSGASLEPLIRKSLLEKAESTGGQLSFPLEVLDASTITNRSMTAIGG